MLVNGFSLIRGHFAYQLVYAGRPLADGLATVTTTATAEAAASTATSALIRRRMTSMMPHRAVRFLRARAVSATARSAR